MKMEAGIGAPLLQAEEDLEVPRAGSGKEGHSPGPLKGLQTCQPLDSRLQNFRTVSIHSCCYSVPNTSLQNNRNRKRTS